MGEALNPSPLSRLTQALRPDWTRTAAARRVTAGALVVLAGAAALRPDPADGRADVVVFAHDLAPGVELTAADLRVESRSTTTIPDGSQADPAALARVDAGRPGPPRGGAHRRQTAQPATRGGHRRAGRAGGAATSGRRRPARPHSSRRRGGRAGRRLRRTRRHVDEQPRVVATDAVVVLVSEEVTSPGRGDDRRGAGGPARSHGERRWQARRSPRPSRSPCTEPNIPSLRSPSQRQCGGGTTAVWWSARRIRARSHPSPCRPVRRTSIPGAQEPGSSARAPAVPPASPARPISTIATGTSNRIDTRSLQILYA